MILTLALGSPFFAEQCCIEYDPAYCDVIIRRFEAVTGTSATLARTGQTVEDVAAASSRPDISHDSSEVVAATPASGEYVQ